jgi:transcriptional regulator with XRE-family HTH domain
MVLGGGGRRWGAHVFSSVGLFRRPSVGKTGAQMGSHLSLSPRQRAPRVKEALRMIVEYMKFRRRSKNGQGDMSSIDQIRAARGLLRWSRVALAEVTGLSESTIMGVESALGDVSAAAIAKMVAALEAAGCEFTSRPPGVKAKLRESGHKVRLRPAAERQAATLVIGPRDVATVEEWRLQRGDPPGGRFRLRLASGAITDWLDTSNFERA